MTHKTHSVLVLISLLFMVATNSFSGNDKDKKKAGSRDDSEFNYEGLEKLLLEGINKMRKEVLVDTLEINDILVRFNLILDDREDVVIGQEYIENQLKDIK